MFHFFMIILVKDINLQLKNSSKEKIKFTKHREFKWNIIITIAHVWKKR